MNVKECIAILSLNLLALTLVDTIENRYFININAILTSILRKQ